jgi:putative addiction module CopG family antidote
MLAADAITNWASHGRYHFSTEEAATALGTSVAAARAALRRLRTKGAVAMPQRGFWVVVPPEYRRLGCLPPEQFIPQLMEQLGLGYYGALLSAARYHGAAHQQPQVFHVMVEKNRPPIACGEVRVTFVARRNVEKIPTRLFNTPRGVIRMSSAEATAFDLVGYPGHAGGLDHVATMLVELAESLAPDRLAALASLSPVPWAQRLGYLLSRVDAGDRVEALAEYVARHARETVPLDPGVDHQSAARDARWKLTVNADVTPEGEFGPRSPQCDGSGIANLDNLRYRRDPSGMNVSLTPELEELVQKKVQSGRYTSASEVIRDALRLLAERDELREVELQALRDRVEQGLAEARRGELVDGEEAFRVTRRRGRLGPRTRE